MASSQSAPVLGDFLNFGQFLASDLRRTVPLWMPDNPNAQSNSHHATDNDGAGCAITRREDIDSNPGDEFAVPVQQIGPGFLDLSADNLLTPLYPPSPESKQGLFLRRYTGITLTYGTTHPKEILSKNRNLCCFYNSPSIDHDLLYNGGGGLCFLENGEHNVLLYSSGKHLNNLVYLPVVTDSSTLMPIWGARKSVKLARKIYQVSTMAVDRTVFYGVRMDRKLSIGRFQSPDKNYRPFKKLCRVIAPDNLITDLNLSPFAFEFVFANDNGSANISNIEICKVVDSIRMSSTTRSRWYACSFASHPRCLVYAKSTALVLQDRRSGAKRSLTLLKSPSLAVNEREKFCSLAAPVSPHLYYVGSTRSVFLVDDRYPQHPILAMKHQIESKPELASAVHWNSTSQGSSRRQNDVIFVASRSSQETVSLHVRHCHDKRNGQLATSARLPQRLTSPKDLPDVLFDNNRSIDYESRLFLGLPLHGICCVPLGGRSANDAPRRLAVVRQALDGNLYCQTFGHSEIGPDLLSDTASDDKEHELDAIQRWCNTLASDMHNSLLDFDQFDLETDRVKDCGLFVDIMDDDRHSHACLSCCTCVDVERPDADELDGDDDEECCRGCSLPVKLTKMLHTYLAGKGECGKMDSAVRRTKRNGDTAAPNEGGVGHV